MQYKVSIPVSNVKVGMIPAAPIFYKNEQGVEVMLARAETPLTDAIIDKLRNRRINSIYIFSDTPPPEKKLIGTSKPATHLISPIKTSISVELHNEALSGIHGLFDLASGNSFVTAHHVVKELNDVVDKLVETVLSKESGMVHISDLRSYDEYTYHHSLSVAVLSIAIGQEMGLSAGDLQQLGQCAIMHDIGKVMTPIEIINKPSKLTPEEFDIIREHAENGSKYLQHEGIGNALIWNVVSSHHEKINGTGYPKGLERNEIPLFSRIIAVADVYDALTSYRSYRKPMAPAVALEMIMSDIGTAFDYEVVSAFTRKIELYPINTVIELSNKRTGIVVNNHYFMRPVIKMLDDGALIDLASMDYLTLMIERVLE